ncbi:hypothetical protein P910_002616 [Xylella fastidiosa Mul-MD]|nr:hypothetical protein P303_10725 [Xylella fastidiosa MUL0034]EWG14207.1 hypothetical protein P910_002616 [Xylella fastidiosa Mul-MD]
MIGMAFFTLFNIFFVQSWLHWQRPAILIAITACWKQAEFSVIGPSMTFQVSKQIVGDQ